MARYFPLSDQQLEDIASGGVYRLAGAGEPVYIGRAEVLAELDESLGVVSDGRRSEIAWRVRRDGDKLKSRR